MLRISNKISVIVPCYNYAHYLKECLDSLMVQTVKSHEIIVVSDGSPDIEDMKKVLVDFPDVKLVEKVNGGLSSARNAGITIATGDYIMCLDADDKLVPAALEEHLKLMVDDMTIAQCGLMEFGDRHCLMIPTKTKDLKRLLASNTIFCNALFPRKAWVEASGYDESEIMRAGYEDWEFWIRCLAKGYTLNTSDFIALRYRVHEGQMTQATSHPNDKKLRDYIKEKHHDLYEKFDLLDY